MDLVFSSIPLSRLRCMGTYELNGRSIQPIPVLRFTMLLHDYWKTKYIPHRTNKGLDIFMVMEQSSTEIAKQVLERLKFDRKSKESIIYACQSSRYPL